MSKPTSRWMLVAWALPATGHIAMIWMVMVYLLKFSTDVLGIGPAVVGGLFGLGRLWDAVSDPAVGFWSDRTVSRYGRRRPWMAAAALPIALSFYALWCPPAGLSGSALVAWTGGSLLLLYTALTIFSVPHASLGAELSFEHHRRTGIFALRAGFELAGMLLAIAAIHWLENAGDPREAARQAALVLGSVTAAWILISAAVLREPASHSGRGARRPLNAFRDVWRNEHARLLLLVFFLTELGLGALAATVPYMSSSVMQGEGQSGLFLLAFLVPAVLSIGFWVPVSGRIGKRNAWLVATAVSAVCFAGFNGLDDADRFWIILGVGLIGLAQGAMRILPHSIKADVIDLDELRTGERKEGAYFATWNLVQKTAGAVAIALTGVLLELSGIGAGADGRGVRFEDLMLVCAVIPAVLMGLATLLLARFRFGEREHARVRAKLGTSRDLARIADVRVARAPL